MTLLTVAISAAFIVVTGFVFVFSVKRVIDSGVWCPWYVKLIARVWLVIASVADAAFNWLWGSVIFREPPKELMFSARVKRHYRKASGWRYEKAAQWREFLNAIDPGHID